MTDTDTMLAEPEVWAAGRQAARARLEPRDCPHPWHPGLRPLRLHWMQGLADGYRETAPRSEGARRAARALKRERCDAASTARPYGHGGAPVWFVRLMRRLLPV
jgi:hypothetical protein